jgi:uncharacterized membrane protein
MPHRAAPGAARAGVVPALARRRAPLRKLGPVRADPASPPTPAIPPASGAVGRTARLELVDAARGWAIVQMVAYHFCYDLNHYGWIRIDMYADGRWIAWRTAIVAQFLFLVGVSLALRAQASAEGTRPNWRRWPQVAGCAALVSLASWQLFGARWIWFGVLHFVALAQLLLPPLARRRRAALALGVLALGLGLAVHLPAFAADALSWIGFSPVKPQTEDFVPLLPWIGVVLLGIGATNLWRPRVDDVRLAPGPILGLPAPAGRWPLTVYMLHQPILFGLLGLIGPRA